jgi:hypothetical protein
MTDDELPPWMLCDYVDIMKGMEEDSANYGRGTRVRKEVNYDDGLSENKWLKIIEGDNPEEKLEEIKKKRREKMLQKESAAMAEEKSSSEHKRKGSLLEGKPSKRQKRTEQEKPITDFYSKLQRIWERVRDLQEPETNRVRSRMFMRLPSKKDYPDYYEVIQNPIDMKKIESKIAKGHYTSREEFEADFDLLFNNAQEFNMPESQIFLDAQILQVRNLEKKIYKFFLKLFEFS